MNKDCKVSIERDANGSLSVLLTGHKDDIRMLWTMLSVSVAKATKTPLPVLCAVCSAAGPAIEDLMAKENGITVDMSALGRFAKGDTTALATALLLRVLSPAYAEAVRRYAIRPETLCSIAETISEKTLVFSS